MMKKVYLKALPLALALIAAKSSGATVVDLSKNTSAMYGFSAGEEVVNLANDKQFREKSSFVTPSGHKVVRYQQYYQGVPVYGHSVIGKSGMTSHNLRSTPSASSSGMHAVDGSLIQNIASDIRSVKPKIDAGKILDSAIQLGKASGKVAQPAGSGMALSADSKKSAMSQPDSLIKNKQAKLYVYLDKTNKARMAYLVSYFVAGSKPHRPFFIMDANTGVVIKSWDGLTTAEATGSGGNKRTGKYFYGKDKPALNVTRDGGSSVMENDNVKTVNLKHWEDDDNGGAGGPMNAFEFKGTNHQDDSRDAINGAYSPLNDAHYMGNVIYDMYQNWYHMPPLKFKLVMRVHYATNYDNAFWNGETMNFGDGDGRMLYPLVSLDVAGHEISHGVTEQNSNLEYDGQSGGMNEAFSDMAGATAVYYATNKAAWHIGDTIMVRGDALRYMDNPTRDGISIDNANDYYKGINVHYSSGVYNKAFYELSTTNGWDPKKAFEVFLDANKVYWNASSNFSNGACGVAKAAKDLGYSSGDVASAFSKVGIKVTCI